jgi:hypothetical protein
VPQASQGCLSVWIFLPRGGSIPDLPSFSAAYRQMIGLVKGVYAPSVVHVICMLGPMLGEPALSVARTSITSVSRGLVQTDRQTDRQMGELKDTRVGV